MTYPKISVITPSYNQGEFLETTIVSVLNQEYPNLEYIVMDGGSKDQSIEIIKKYEKYFTYWVSEKDKGQADAINRGLKMATGDILVWLNSDDFFYPHAFDYVSQAYQKYPQAGLYIGNGYICNRAGEILHPYSLDVGFDADTLINGQNYVNQPSIFINRIAYEKVGGLDESLYYELDAEYWIRIGKEFKAVIMEEFLSGYRWYDEIKTASGVFDRWMEMYKVRRKYTKKRLTPGLLVEFLMLARGDDVVNDLGLDVKQMLEQAYQRVFTLNQSALNLKNNVPFGRGIYFKPKKTGDQKTGSKSAHSPAVLSHPGSNPRVDVVLPEGHSWFVREGYVQALKQSGCLGQVFYIPSWAPEDGRSQILFDYLQSPQADAIFLMDTIWHGQQVHNTAAWQHRWQSASLKKILFSFECMSNPWFKSNQNWWRDNHTAVENAMPCIDGLIFAHEIDQELFSGYGAPTLWQPFAIDEEIFPTPLDYSQKKPRGFFKGKAIHYYNEDACYRSRRELIDFLKKSSPKVDVVDQYDDTGPTIEKNKRFLDEINKYQVVLGLPSLSPTMVVRPFEALGCKNVFFQNKVLGERTNALFEDKKDLFFYDPEEPQDLVKAIDFVLENPDIVKKVAESGYEKVMEAHTIKHRVAEALDWSERSLPKYEHPTASRPAEIAGSTAKMQSGSGNTGKKILIDGITFLFQRYRPAGISRVWTAFLKELAKTDLAKDILLLDREGTSPQIPGIARRLIKGYDLHRFESDSLYLQTICDEENAGLFISTYYSYPENTNSIIMLHDMIPEVKAQDLTHPEWRAKTKAIEKACAYLCVSQSTMNDFRKIYPQYADRKIYLTPNAVSDHFKIHTNDDINRFKIKHGIQKPYFLIVGRRLSYKNAILFFRAFSLLENKTGYEIVCTGEKGELEKEFKPYVRGVKCHVLQLDNDELSTAYSGAIALLYPSQYEGFGLPILEAQRSGCPVITCRNSSLTEVAGDTVYYTDDVDVAQMRDALLEIQTEEVRNRLVSSGLENIKRFSWEKTGQALKAALEDIQQNIETIPAKETDAINTVGRLIQFLSRQSVKGKLLAEKIARLEKFFLGKITYNYLAFLECEDDLISELPEFFDQILANIGRLDDCDSVVLYILGLAFEGKGALKEALGAYSGAIKVIPDDGLIYNYRVRVGYRAAELAYGLGEYSAAKKFLTKIVLDVQSDHEEAVALLFKVNKALGEKKYSEAGLLATHMKPLPSKEFTETPVVSVLVSAYNSEEYLRGLLDDLEAQTIAGQTEIIVVDSGSQQNEREIVESFQRQYPNIRYVRTMQRESVYGAWNRAIEVAQGKYLTNANTDDRHAPDAFEIMVNALEEHPEVGVVYGDSAVTQKKNTTLVQGPIIGRLRWPEFDRRLLFQICFIGPHPMWRRSLHEQFGGFDEKMTSAGDYEFWLRVSDKTYFHHIPQVLGLYLMAEQSLEHREISVSVKEAQEARKRYWNHRNEGLPPSIGPIFLENYQATSKVGKKFPLVSVIMPTFNRPKELAAALESIANQTYPEIEVIVINDGGKDVAPVLQRFEKKLSIKYKRQEKNEGAGSARNVGMVMAKGKYIAFLDDDDIYRPEHLFTLVAELETNSSIVAAYSDALQSVVEQDGDKAKILAKDVYFSVDFSSELLLVRNYIPNLCLAFRREALELAGLFNTQMSALEDWEWLIRLSKVGPFSHIPVVTAEYVVRQGTKSRNILASSEIAALYQYIYNTHAVRSSKGVEQARKQYFHTMTGLNLDAAIPGISEEINKQDGRAVETLQLLLESEDLVQSLEKNKGRLDSELLELVRANAEAAAVDGNNELAEGLSDLADYIQSLIE